jgi:tetraacyldisaccharide 4'-kinase
VFWLDFTIGALRRFGGAESLDRFGGAESLDRFGGVERLELPAPSPGPLFAFCALGHPEAFYADLLVAGLPWTGTLSFRDHQALAPRQFRQLQAAALASGAAGLVCTEKDAVKLDENTPLTLPLWVAEQRVTGGEALTDWLLQRLGWNVVPPGPAGPPPPG